MYVCVCVCVFKACTFFLDAVHTHQQQLTCTCRAHTMCAHLEKPQMRKLCMYVCVCVCLRHAPSFLTQYTHTHTPTTNNMHMQGPYNLCSPGDATNEELMHICITHECTLLVAVYTHTQQHITYAYRAHTMCAHLGSRQTRNLLWPWEKSLVVLLSVSTCA